MQGNVRLFEIGAAFQPRQGALPHEEMRIAALVMGDRRPAHFTEPNPPVFDEWDAKAIAERIAAVAFGAGAAKLVPAEDSTSGVLWSVRHAGTGSAIGVVRRVALDAPVWAAPAFGIELTLSVVDSAPVAAPGEHAHAEASESASPARALRYTPLPVTPAADFDLALVVPNDMPAERVHALIIESSGELLERLQLFDEFRGAGVPEGTRSLAWRLTFRHPERTLRDKELEGRRSKLLRTLEAELGVKQRSI
jgi:phenylalanyl-tRNA synthetase beta chain